ncbi:wee1-like protein kinase-like [Hibiscus syriacus]|uniref:Wee1-like protein kinase-like n=1 Tax=Hibiscus syriacus TaxID=106335 RepID=A0A6A3A5L5_HIBSY|nr:wee1-like protein kinase-like [Hibiscus syriacus]
MSSSSYEQPIMAKVRGTFALYSLICRYARVSLIPSQQAEDRQVSNYRLELPSKRLKLASVLKSSLENSQFAKIFLLFITMLGTSMVIGDSVLTPSISVLSAVGGVKEATSHLTEDMIAGISIVILVFLFMIQRFGTSKVGYGFAPILYVWFILIGGIGFYNIVKHDTTVLKAINPMYIVDYFIRNKKEAWVSLGGVVLCTTGSLRLPPALFFVALGKKSLQIFLSGGEALFADVDHFSVRSIQLSMCSLVYPALILAYTGQSAYLLRHPDAVSDAFFKAIPGPMFWPMFIVSIVAAVIASQAMISDHSKNRQRLWNCCCVCNDTHIIIAGSHHDYDMENQHILVILYVVTIGFVELLYLSSVLYKFSFGGYLPLAFSAFLMTVMYVWNNVYRRKYFYELNHKIPLARLKDISANKKMARIPGLAMFYSELVHGIPPIFEHYVSHVPALHSVIVFVSMKSLHINKVTEEERYFFQRVEPRELCAFRCVVRYGYKDVKEEAFEETLFTRLKQFIQEETLLQLHTIMRQEIEQVENAWEEAGMVHLIGQSEVIASEEAGIMKRILIDYAYNLLKRNLRQSETVFNIPHKRMLKLLTNLSRALSLSGRDGKRVQIRGFRPVVGGGCGFEKFYPSWMVDGWWIEKYYVGGEGLQPAWILVANAQVIHQDFLEASCTHRRGNGDGGVASLDELVHAASSFHWCPPNSGVVNINLDDSFESGSCCIAVGVAARDHLGRILGGLAQAMHGIGDPGLTEIHAFSVVLSLACDDGWENVLFEFDCAQLVNKLVRDDENFSA